MGQQQEPLGESASRLGRFKGTDTVKKIQDFAKAEEERKKKKAAGVTKPPAVTTEPTKGFIGRMIDKYYYGKTEEKRDPPKGITGVRG